MLLSAAANPDQMLAIGRQQGWPVLPIAFRGKRIGY
jgi:hypothetical protein